MIDIFNTSSSNQADPQRARQVSARELLDIGAQKLEGALANEPAVRQQLALMLSGLYSEMGLVKRSVPLARTALALAEQVHGRASPAHLTALALLLNELRASGSQAELQRPLAEAELLLALRSPRGGARPASAERADLMLSLAMVREGNQVQTALTLAQQAEGEARSAGATGVVSRALQAQGHALMRTGAYAQAASRFQAGLGLADALAGGHDRSVLPARMTLAESQMHLLRTAPAMHGMRQALAEVESREGADHVDAWQIRFRLGAALGTLGFHGQAVSLLQPLAEQLRVLGAAQDVLRTVVIVDLASNLRDRGDFDAAEALQREALAVRERLRPGSGVVARLREDLAGTLTQRGSFAEAAALLDSAQALRSANGDLPADIGPVRGLLLRLNLARAQGDSATAQRLARALPSEPVHRETPTRAQLLMALEQARVALDSADPPCAAAWLRTVEEALRRLVSPGAYPALEAPLHLLCGRVACSAGQQADAERRFSQAEGLLAEVGPEGALRKELARAWLG